MTSNLMEMRKTPHTRSGTEKGYYVYIEDEGGVYLETIDERGVPTLDTETDSSCPQIV